MAYTTYDQINLDSNITSSDISNSDITSLITKATKILNSKINIPVEREPVLYLDDTRKNEINGTTTTFYIANWEHGFLADSTGDGSVSTSDLTVYLVDPDGVETTATISSISTANKSFTLSSAPASTYRMYVSYHYCFKNPATPDSLIVLACEYLTIALCYAKVNIGRAPSVSFGNKRITRHMGAYQEYWDLAMQIVEEINYKGPNLKDVQ